MGVRVITVCVCVCVCVCVISRGEGSNVANKLSTTNISFNFRE